MSEEEKECIKWTIKYAYMHICDFEPEESETIKKAEKAIETILAEIEKKDKIIDAMTEYIEEINYIDIDDNECEFETRHQIECPQASCKDCIKQYFERRAE